jgi:predicted ATP-dependent endonuclease of OLD family
MLHRKNIFFGTRHFYLNNGRKQEMKYVFTSNSSHLTDKLPVFNKIYFYEEINEIRTYWLNTFKVDKGSSSLVKRWFHFGVLKCKTRNLIISDIFRY